MDLLYKNEKPLFFMLLIVSLLVWGGLIVGSKGMVFGYLIGFFFFYAFAQSAFISYLKGTAVKITPEQFPDLHEKIVACCRKLNLPDVPDAYLLHMGGAFNALATRFFGRNFIVLYSDVVDALEERPDTLNFYIGHEIGHIKRNHLRWAPVLFPAAILPLIGAAYSRAREYTCDRHGLAACEDGASAQFGLGALAAGGKRWRTMNRDQYISQTQASSGFWMSFHELTSDYPWLTKRVAAVRTLVEGGQVRQPGRHPLAWLLALFIPRFGIGGAGSIIVVIAMIGIMAAIGIPAYHEYTVRARMAEAVSVGNQATAAVANYYHVHRSVPRTLAQAGFSLSPAMSGVQSIELNPTDGIMQLTLAAEPYAGKAIVFVPSLDVNKRIVWRCSSREIKAEALPQNCRG
jgi:Zn-dependent protease with chaperone function/type II secretory pathway pseudopilin PulG